jgi:hypothetical protein
MQRGFFRVPFAGPLADTNHLSQDNRRPCKRASKTTRSDDRSSVRVGTPLLVALSPEQKQEAITLLGQLLLDATPTAGASVSTGAWMALSPALSTARPRSAKHAARRTGTRDPAGEQTPDK